MLTIICNEMAKRRAINRVVGGYGAAVRSWLDEVRTTIHVLRPTQRYCEVSRELRRRSAPFDSWPVPPAGLFVVPERTIYLRSVSPMAIAHELMHAYDCALGGGIYYSDTDPRVRRLFRQARAFVTPYAASSIAEYFAECGRALHSNGNDPRSPWPDATADRLRQVDPAMYDYITCLFAEYPARVRAS